MFWNATVGVWGEKELSQFHISPQSVLFLGERVSLSDFLVLQFFTHMAQSALWISHAFSGTWKYHPFFLRGSLKQSIWSSYSFRKWNLSREVVPYLPLAHVRVTALRQHLPLLAVSIFGALESFSRAWLKQSARQCRKQSPESICPDINWISESWWNWSSRMYTNNRKYESEGQYKLIKECVYFFPLQWHI